MARFRPVRLVSGLRQPELSLCHRLLEVEQPDHVVAAGRHRLNIDPAHGVSPSPSPSLASAEARLRFQQSKQLAGGVSYAGHMDSNENEVRRRSNFFSFGTF